MNAATRSVVTIPQELRLFVSLVLKKVPSALSVAQLDPDDVFETELASACLVEGSASDFTFTFRGEPGQHWHFRLPYSEFAAVAAGRTQELEVSVESVPIGGRLADLLDALMGGGDLTVEEPEEEEEDPFASRELLELLLKEEHLELVEGADIGKLSRGVSAQLAASPSAEAQARNLSAWLLDQDMVEEVYIDDESLEAILSAW